MEREDFQEILSKISYKNWTLRLGENNGYFFLQWLFEAPHNRTGEMMTQRCRKWQLSKFMTPTEVVRTAYKAALAAEEHEVGEYFKYKNELIFCPHIDVEALLNTVDKLDAREGEK